jgi:hypothetical protein
MKSFRKPMVLGLLLVAFAPLSACEKDEPPPPLPSAAPAATTAAEPLVLEPEPEPTTPEPEAEAPKKKGGAPAANFAKCCAALRQNAENSPEPNKTYMVQAAATCDALVGAGQATSAIQSAVRGALRGAQMPAGCL